MNDRHGRSVSATGRNVMRSRAARALAVGLVLAFLGSAAMAIERQVPAGTIVLVVRGTAPLPPGSDLPTASDPIPGVDIIVRKKPTPPKTAIVVPVDASGAFSVRLKESGNYTVSTACRTGGCPSVALSINVAGTALQPGADGTANYDFSVGKGGLDLGGQIFVRGAQPIIVNGKRIAPQGRWDDIDIVHGIKIVEIKGNESPEESPGPAIVTSRANIKRPGAAATPPVDVLPRSVTIGPGQPFVPGGGTPGAAMKEAGAKDPEKQRSKISENASPLPTTRGTAPGPTGGDGELAGKHNYKGIVTLVRGVAPQPTGGDGKAGISDQAAAGGLTSYSTAPRPDGPVDNKPLLRIELLIKIALEGGGAGAPAHGRWVSTTTADANGAFKFDKLPPGKYKLTVADQAPRSVTVGADGTAGGSVMRGSDGGMAIFDRWGKLLAVSPSGEERQSKEAAEKLGGFGAGLGGVRGMGPGMGPGGGMAPPIAGPGMSPMGPGAMGPGPMGPGAMGLGGGTRP